VAARRPDRTATHRLPLPPGRPLQVAAARRTSAWTAPGSGSGSTLTAHMARPLIRGSCRSSAGTSCRPSAAAIVTAALPSAASDTSTVISLQRRSRGYRNHRRTAGPRPAHLLATCCRSLAHRLLTKSAL
jgi:hypothetical protein